MGLELYSKVEPYLGFENEVNKLYNTYYEYLKKYNIKKFIDIGCGQGEFLKLVGFGKGIDLSYNQIEIAKKKGLDVECIDIKDIKDSFNGAVAIFDVVNYISNLDSFFKNVYKILNKNALFIFDINTEFAFLEIIPGVLYKETNNLDIIIDANYDNNIAKTDIIVFTKDNNCIKKEKDTIYQYYYSIDKIKKIAKKNKFKIEFIDNIYLYDFDYADKYLIGFRK